MMGIPLNIEGSTYATQKRLPCQPESYWNILWNNEEVKDKLTLYTILRTAYLCMDDKTRGMPLNIEEST